MKETITQEYLKSVVMYDEDSGLFTWLVRINSRSKVGDTAGSNSNGYTRIAIGDVEYYAHRLAFLYVKGYFPFEVDHENRIKSDNRWVNLREVSKSENQRNSPMQKNNTSGTCGVSFHKLSQRWSAYIKINGKHIDLGRFIKIEDACAARKTAEIEYNFHPTHGK